MTTRSKEANFFPGDGNFMKDLMPSVTSGSGKAVENADNNKTDFLEILGNKYMNAILSRTSVKECSASELCNELNIPLATVYRKLKLLTDSGLIETVKTVINISGNEERFYHCLLSEATVNFHGGKISVNMKIMDNGNKITRIWKRATKSGVIAKEVEMED